MGGEGRVQGRREGGKSFSLCWGGTVGEGRKGSEGTGREKGQEEEEEEEHIKDSHSSSHTR